MKKIKTVNFIVGSSGCGKNEIFSIINNRINCIRFMISYTTRLPREGEIDNKDYYFVNNDKFNSIKPELMEFIEFGNKSYGYHKDEILNHITDKNHFYFIIEPHGIEQILTWFNNNIIGINLLKSYKINFNILHVKTKKSIRINRLLKSISKNESYENDFNKTNIIINRVQREDDSIDKLLHKFLPRYLALEPTIKYDEINNDGTKITLVTKYLMKYIETNNKINFYNIP